MVLKKLKELFSKKEEREKIKESLKELENRCVFCGEEIKEGEEYEEYEFQGIKFKIHKKCMRKARKLALQLMRKGVKPEQLLRELNELLKESK